KSKPIGYLPRAMKGAADGGLQRFAIVRISQLAKLSVQHCFAAAVQTAGDHRYSRGHGLEKDEPKSLLPAGHDKNVGDAVVVGLLRFSHTARKDHVLVDPERHRLVLQAPPVVTVASNQIG